MKIHENTPTCGKRPFQNHQRYQSFATFEEATAFLEKARDNAEIGLAQATIRAKDPARVKRPDCCWPEIVFYMF